MLQYLDLLFFGHALSSTVAGKLLNFVSDKKLSVRKLLSISSDGLNVNKAILQKLNEELVDAKMPFLINIGTSSLHAVHNAFGKSLQSFGSDAEVWL